MPIHSFRSVHSIRWLASFARRTSSWSRPHAPHTRTRNDNPSKGAETTVLLVGWAFSLGGCFGARSGAHGSLVIPDFCPPVEASHHVSRTARRLACSAARSSPVTPRTVQLISARRFPPPSVSRVFHCSSSFERCAASPPLLASFLFPTPPSRYLTTGDLSSPSSSPLPPFLPLTTPPSMAVRPASSRYFTFSSPRFFWWLLLLVVTEHAWA